MSRELTLMAVHAHPDDEASSTGGVLAHYADLGIRTVVVTCTNGELGDGPNGEKPGEEGHDADDVARQRLDELERACRILKVGHVETLGYRDSGMHGWDGNSHDGAFCNVAVVDAAARLQALFARHRPHVVITYDENGGYGHPDHVQAHRITAAAVGATDSAAKLYYTARPRSTWAKLRERLEERGVQMPPPPPRREGQPLPGTDDHLITTSIDVSHVIDRKIGALQAHASQTSRSPNLAYPDIYREFFATEWFVRAYDTTKSPVPETDLFIGIM